MISGEHLVAKRFVLTHHIVAVFLIFFFFVAGVGGILVMGLGIIISGVFILRVKPNARFVAAWIAFTAVIYAVGTSCVLLFSRFLLHKG